MRIGPNQFLGFLCLLTVSIGFARPMLAQSDEDPIEIVENFIEALGGQMVLEGIENLKVKAVYSGGTTGESQFYVKSPMRLDVMKSRSNIFDGKRWLARSGSENWARESTPTQLHLRGALFDLPTDALELLKIAHKMKVLEKEKYADGDYAQCVCLVEDFGDGLQTRRFFDPDSSLMVCIERYSQTGTNERLNVRYGEMKYEEFEGILFLKSSVRTNESDWTCNAEYSDFEIGVNFDDSLFEMEVADD